MKYLVVVEIETEAESRDDAEQYINEQMNHLMEESFTSLVGYKVVASECIDCDEEIGT